jgi:hypothetical protein
LCRREDWNIEAAGRTDEATSELAIEKSRRKQVKMAFKKSSKRGDTGEDKR